MYKGSGRSRAEHRTCRDWGCFLISESSRMHKSTLVTLRLRQLHISLWNDDGTAPAHKMIAPS